MPEPGTTLQDVSEGPGVLAASAEIDLRAERRAEDLRDCSLPEPTSHVLAPSLQADGSPCGVAKAPYPGSVSPDIAGVGVQAFKRASAEIDLRADLQVDACALLSIAFFPSGKGVEPGKPDSRGDASLSTGGSGVLAAKAAIDLRVLLAVDFFPGKGVEPGTPARRGDSASPAADGDFMERTEMEACAIALKGDSFDFPSGEDRSKSRWGRTSSTEISGLKTSAV